MAQGRLITRTKTVFAVVLAALLAIAGSLAQAPEKSGPIELNTILMQSTFKVEGPGSVGTVFVLGRPLPKEPGKARYVLITAAHILEQMQGEHAILHLRRFRAPSRWERIPFQLQIRVSGQALWKKHPRADIAVMYIGLPADVVIPLLPTDLLADDKLLEKFEVHPGDELNCLGYPFGAEGNAAGFPILRSGKISSYPLLPTSETASFLFDFRVFKGNSGGPVYFVQSGRTYGGAAHLGETIQFLIGLVTQEKVLKQQISEPYALGEREYQLGLAEVVHANLIREALNLLPPPE